MPQAAPISTYSSFQNYFKSYKLKFSIQEVVCGDSARILNLQNSAIEYPCLWLHTPDIKPFESGGRKNRFTSDLLILNTAPADDYEQQEQNFQDCLEIVWKVLRQMERDADDGLFEFDIASVDIQPKAYLTADNCNGWFVSFSLAAAGCDNDCCDDEL